MLLALRIRPASPIGAASDPRFAYKGRMSRSANNSSFGSYIAPIYWRYVACTALPIDPELAYNLDSTDRKRKYGKTKTKSEQNDKRMPSATVRDSYASINTIFDPP